MKTIINWFVSALAILVTAYILPGIYLSGFLTALVVAVILGAINAILRPILIFFTLPLTILSFGLFVLIINGFLVMLASYIVSGFEVAGFWSAFLFAIVLAIVNWALQMFEGK